MSTSFGDSHGLESPGIAEILLCILQITTVLLSVKDYLRICFVRSLLQHHLSQFFYESSQRLIILFWKHGDETWGFP